MGAHPSCNISWKVLQKEAKGVANLLEGSRRNPECKRGNGGFKLNVLRKRSARDRQSGQEILKNAENAQLSSNLGVSRFGAHTQMAI